MRTYTFDELFENYTNGQLMREQTLVEILDALDGGKVLFPVDLAEKLGVAKRDLQSAFLLITGLQLCDVIPQWNVRKAKLLIAKGELPLQEVALSRGWKSVRSMDKVFLRQGEETASAMAHRLGYAEIKQMKRDLRKKIALFQQKSH